MKVITYYTPHYAGEAKRLEASCRQHGVDLTIRELPCRGDWTRNTRAKIAVLIWARLQWPGMGLLWLDADAEVLAPLVLPWRESRFDVGCHWHQRDDGKASPGTVYLGPDLDSYHFLLAWMEGCSGDLTDQDTFDAALRMVDEDRVWRMPAQWCWIPDIDGPIPDPIIRQHQASRRLRKCDT